MLVQVGSCVKRIIKFGEPRTGAAKLTQEGKVKLAKGTYLSTSDRNHINRMTTRLAAALPSDGSR